jgi:hypothetical protein
LVKPGEKLKRLALAITLLSLPISLHAQHPASSHSQTNQSEYLSKPVSWGSQTIRVFKDSKKEMTFTLATSWIPGPDHTGMFRYKMNAFPKKLTLDEQSGTTELFTPEANEKFIDRVHVCSLTLTLFDADQFKLRDVGLIFTLGVDDNAREVALNTNSSVQMDASEYKKFIGDSAGSGSWSLNWDCGGA